MTTNCCHWSKRLWITPVRCWLINHWRGLKKSSTRWCVTCTITASRLVVCKHYFMHIKLIHHVISVISCDLIVRCVTWRTSIPWEYIQESPLWWHRHRRWQILITTGCVPLLSRPSAILKLLASVTSSLPLTQSLTRWPPLPLVYTHILTLQLEYLVQILKFKYTEYLILQILIRKSKYPQIFFITVIITVLHHRSQCQIVTQFSPCIQGNWLSTSIYSSQTSPGLSTTPIKELHHTGWWPVMFHMDNKSFVS